MVTGEHIARIKIAVIEDVPPRMLEYDNSASYIQLSYCKTSSLIKPLSSISCMSSKVLNGAAIWSFGCCPQQRHRSYTLMSMQGISRLGLVASWEPHTEIFRKQLDPDQKGKVLNNKYAYLDQDPDRKQEPRIRLIVLLYILIVDLGTLGGPLKRLYAVNVMHIRGVKLSQPMVLGSPSVYRQLDVLLGGWVLIYWAVCRQHWYTVWYCIGKLLASKRSR